MEGVLDAALCVCVFRLMISVLLCPSVLTHTITAVSLCCFCLFLFTDLAVTLFLLYLWLMEFWMMPFCVPSDVIALRFLLFLCQAYGVVLLLTPPLVAVELLVNMLQAQDLRIKQNASESHHNQCLSKTVGFIGCLLAWIVSAIYCSHDWTLEQISVEDCLKKGGWFVLCLPNVDELSWVHPALVLLLSLGLIRTKTSRRPPENTQDYVVLRQKDMSVTPVEVEKAAVSCGVLLHPL